MERIILFDGVCNLCNDSVQFILKRDKRRLFKFGSLQSQTGQNLIKLANLPADINSFVLIEEKHVYIKSSAALRVCLRLKGFWPVMAIFLIVPPFIRDLFYDLLAKNRYRWFGKMDSCMIPSAEWKNRFLE